MDLAHPAGESDFWVLRLDFDRRLRLESHGSKVTTDAGLFAYRELDYAVEFTEMVGDVCADNRIGKNWRHGVRNGLWPSTISAARRQPDQGHAAPRARAWWIITPPRWWTFTPPLTRIPRIGQKNY